MREHKPMRLCRSVIATVVCVAVIACAAKASAQTLAPHEVYKLRSPSVVFFRSALTGEGMSFGVLISKDGYVLTAKHVVDAFGREPVRATIGSKGGNDLVKFEDKVLDLPELDVSLLKIKDPPAGLQPAPVGKADHFRPGSTKVEILTGLADASTVPLAATISNSIDAKADLWNASGNGINRGNSGSPAFDQFGNVVGFIPSGYAGTGIFQLRTLDSVYEWLKQNNVNVERRIKPDKFMVFVRDQGHQPYLRANMQHKLQDIIERWLGVNRADIDSEPPFMPELLLRSERPSDDVLKVEVNAFGREWVAARDARRLYIYVVQLQFVTNDKYPNSARQFLVTLEHDGTEVTTAKLLSLKEANLGQPAPGRNIDEDREEKLLTDNAFKLLKTAAQTSGTRFRKNGFVLAECLNTEAVPVPPALAGKVREWGYVAAQRLKDELDKVWQKDPVYHSYRLESSIPTNCGRPGFLGDKDKDKEQIERENGQLKAMAELIIQSKVNEVYDPDELSILWQIRTERANDERQATEGTRVKLLGNDLSELAHKISKNWNDMTKNLKQ